MQCILGPFGRKINCRIFGLSVSFPPKVKFLDENLASVTPPHKRQSHFNASWIQDFQGIGQSNESQSFL